MDYNPIIYGPNKIIEENVEKRNKIDGIKLG